MVSGSVSSLYNYVTRFGKEPVLVKEVESSISIKDGKGDKGRLNRKYVVLDSLGKGGFATTLLCHAANDRNAEVAIKIFRLNTVLELPNSKTRHDANIKLADDVTKEFNFQ